jgi:hypothetical protein
MRSHDIAGRFVQYQIDEVKLYDKVQARRKVMKKLREIPVRGHRLGNFQQGLMLALNQLGVLAWQSLVIHDAKIICGFAAVQAALF